MQNSLFNFYYVCWMELDCIKQNPFNQKGHLLEQECLFKKKKILSMLATFQLYHHIYF